MTSPASAGEPRRKPSRVSYELPTALADLSTTASPRGRGTSGSTSVGTAPFRYRDHGRRPGESEDRLREAMRPGSQNPLATRDPDDLGRFGLGMKTASFSQCRRLTARSRLRLGGKWATRCWDLDHIAEVKEWQLLRCGDAEVEPHFTRLSALPHGTAVVWQKLDRLTAGQQTRQ